MENTRLLLLFLFFFSINLLPSTLAIWLTLPSSGTKCVSEEIQNNVVVLADYVIVPDDHGQSPTLAVKVTSPYGNNLHHKENTTHGNFAFTTQETGNYLACFWIDGGNPKGGEVSVNIDWKIGIAAKDWDSVAKKEKIEGVELELKKLEGAVEAIHENLLYLKGSCVEAMPNSSICIAEPKIDTHKTKAQWKRKSLVTFALTILTSSQAILIVWSKRAGKYEYSVTTANFLVETLKCAISLIALGRTWRTEGVTEDNRLTTTFDEVSVYPIPAALYLVKNLLQYYIFAYVDAPGYQILKNFNIISTGVLYRIILKRRLSEIQWAAFVLLTAGCTTAQLNSK